MLTALLHDRYRVETLLGRGGMGCVYLAQDETAKEFVAIKAMVPPDSQPDVYRAALQQFRHEVEVLRGLSHPLLPRVHDTFDQDGHPYLVMDYIKGRTLSAVIGLEDDPLPESMLLAWAAELCDVLDYLHTHDPVVVFRDLKPSNVMLDVDGHLKLIDFGISKQFDREAPEFTSTFAKSCISIGFTPPEQYGGQSDEKSDIYALGATLYALLTGLIPVSSVERAAEVAELVPLRDLRPDVSGPVAAAIEKLMTVRPAERPASISEVRRLLGLPTPLHQATTVRTQWRPHPHLPDAPPDAVRSTRRSGTLQMKYVNANHLRFACLEIGTGPLVLCLHGFPDTAYTWEKIMPELASHGYRVVAPYMRGYPPSGLAPDHDYSTVTVGQDIVALIAALGASNAAVIGHDWGAMASYAAASIQPTAVRKLVVVSIPHPSLLNPLALSKASHFVTFQFRDRTLKQFRKNDFAYLRTIYRLWSPTWEVPDDELGPIRDVFAAPGGLEGALGYYWSFGTDATLPTRAAVRKTLRRPTSVPTLAFYGELDGALDARSFAHSESAFTGPYEVVALPQVGHFVHREAPDVFLEKTLAFIH